MYEIISKNFYTYTIEQNYLISRDNILKMNIVTCDISVLNGDTTIS